ncbi:MAG: DUF434 domain-containing protein [Candidatus Thorarchaeota archaeon]
MNNLTIFLKTAFERLLNPYCDLVYCLDRGYPKTSALTFVANHHNLDQVYRNILSRAALPLLEVQEIERKLIRDPDDLRDNILYVDGYNQLSTYYSLANKDPLILCRDNLLRDIFSSLHSKKNLQIEERFIESFLLGLLPFQPLRVVILLDRQRSHSKTHATIVRNVMAKIGMDGICKVTKSVDSLLKQKTKGITLSHDSAILCSVSRCFDLFNHIYPVPRNSVLNFREITCQEAFF